MTDIFSIGYFVKTLLSGREIHNNADDCHYNFTFIADAVWRTACLDLQASDHS
jgi:hypothetical protein